MTRPNALTATLLRELRDKVAPRVGWHEPAITRTSCRRLAALGFIELRHPRGRGKGGPWRIRITREGLAFADLTAAEAVS